MFIKSIKKATCHSEPDEVRAKNLFPGSSAGILHFVQNDSCVILLIIELLLIIFK